MLQQTTVGAVRARYGKFLSRFPDVASISRAREQSVLAAWSGLGYYARARNLHRAAREIARNHGGRLPRDPEALRSLPGFGEYTAAAVASLAFGVRVPAADANVTRVLSRLFAIEGVAGERRHAADVRRYAAALLPRKRPGDLTAALMDLGQQICTPRRPNCPACPLTRDCAARRRGAVERFPRRRARPPIARVIVAAGCAVRGGRALLVQRDEALLRGLWQFPSAEGRSQAEALARLRRQLARFGARIARGAVPSVTQHTIVRRRLAISVYPAVVSPHRSLKHRDPSAGRWLTPAALDAAPVPTLTRKIATKAGFLSGHSRRILVR